MNPVDMMQFFSGSPLRNPLFPYNDDIRNKPVPRWPDRRSYASHKRKKGGAR
jgi:hypothetical protein